ncbi:MAG: hypothetical protein EOM50_01145 [Erysipelotrichia bacterium]|nr:hypothetical protein [Erysipelotrichia bacterium]
MNKYLFQIVLFFLHHKVIPFLNGLNDKESFTEDDIKSALECYDEWYNTFPLNDIEKLRDIRIERNKRNYKAMSNK